MQQDANQPKKTTGKDSEKSEAELVKASKELKDKIEEAKRRNDMPLDSALGNPKWEKDAADGYLDKPDDDDDR